MRIPTYTTSELQIASRDFHALILRRSCYGLSRRNSLFTGVVRNQKSLAGRVSVDADRESRQNQQAALRITPVDSESMNAIAVTGSAHQSQEKKPTGTFSSLRGLSDRPEAGCGQGSSYSINPMYKYHLSSGQLVFDYLTLDGLTRLS